jgi:hypothetical protein
MGSHKSSSDSTDLSRYTPSDIPFQVIDKILQDQFFLLSLPPQHQLPQQQQQRTMTLFVLISTDSHTSLALLDGPSASAQSRSSQVIIAYTLSYDQRLLRILESGLASSVAPGGHHTSPSRREDITSRVCLVVDVFRQLSMSFHHLFQSLDLLQRNQECLHLQDTFQSQTHFLINYLQLLYSPNGKLYPIIQQIETMLLSHSLITHVTLTCHDTSDGSVLYDSNGMPGAAIEFTQQTTPSSGHRKGDCSYEYSFQVYEILGTLVLETREEMVLSDLNQKIFQILTGITGRRIYELYRGKRNKKILVTLQREIETYKFVEPFPPLHSIPPPLTLLLLPSPAVVTGRCSQKMEMKSKV